MSDFRFPRGARVRARADFDRIFKQGKRVALPVLALHWQPGDNGARLGLAVSRKVDPHAVGRNRIKRALRETFRQHRSRLAAGEYVLVARSGAAKLDGAELGRTFLALLTRARVLFPAEGDATSLPAPAVPGTMPPAPSPPDAAPDSRDG